MKCNDCRAKGSVAKQAVSSFLCIQCGRTFTNEHKDTPLMCGVCSESHGLCEACGCPIIRQKAISELEGADMSLVEVREGTPHCKVHGAMNMVNPSGVWRCITAYRWEKCFSSKGVETTSKLVENACRAGCVMEEKP